LKPSKTPTPQGISEHAGKVALGVMPGGHGESGGWGWAIPKNESPEIQDAAWKFISWVQGEKISIARALQGHAPVRSDVYEDAKVLAKYPYYKQAQDVVSSGERRGDPGRGLEGGGRRARRPDEEDPVTC
jgi:ABC-type glycerol-3-phosphate transport system substrate-binding protein